MELGLTGRTAYVTGAGHGLGEAIADALVAEGVRVVAADVDAARLAEKEREWSASVDARGIVADLATPAEAERAAAEAVRLLDSPPDILINNVGRGFTRPFEETSADEWR